jgi:hypothetical protein
MLPNYQLIFGCKIICSAFIKGYKLVNKRRSFNGQPFYTLDLVKTNSAKDIVAGFVIKTDLIDSLDAWNTDKYERIEVSAYTKRCTEILCEAYAPIDK